MMRQTDHPGSLDDWRDMLTDDVGQDYYAGNRIPRPEVPRTGDICPCCGAEVQSLAHHKMRCASWGQGVRTK
jgi:hypothetical protein